MTVTTVPAIQKLTLQQRLTLLGALMTLPFLAHTLWTGWHERNRDLEDRVESAQVIARLVAAEFSQTIVGTRQLLTLFSAGIDPQQPLHSLCTPLLGKIGERQSTYYQAVVADTDGRIACGINPVPAGSNISDREYFQRALSTRSFATSGLVESRTTGKPTIAAGYPILNADGRVRGAIAVAMDLEWLQQLFVNIELPKDAVASLVDAHGRIVLRHPPLQKSLGRSIPDIDTFLATAATVTEGVVDVTGHDAVDRVVAFARLAGDPGNHLFIRIGVARASIEADAREILISGLTTFALVLLLAITFAWVAARKLVVAPAEKLIDATKRMGISDLGRRTGMADAKSEMGRLAGAFDDMAARLQRSVRALRAMSAGNRAIIRRQTEQELLDAMCAVAVEKGGYPLAMVHYAIADDEKNLLAQAHAGGHDAHVTALMMTWGEKKRGHHPTETAVRTGRMDVIHDVMVEPRFEPWREMATSRGFKSMISFPLKVEGGVIGAFTLAAAETDAFDEDEVELLDEMAADLAFGIETIRSRIQRDAAHAAAERATRYDTVTNLPNRSTLLRRIGHIVRLAQTNGESSTVLIAYMPRMQDLFDGFGHDAGNQILLNLATRLQAFNDFGGFVARISFDEFGVLLLNRNLEETAAIALLLRRLFEQPIKIGGVVIEVQASIGISMLPDHGEEPDLLLRRAGLAAREAVRRDLPSLVYVGDALREPLQLGMVAELRKAIDRNELTLHYQPKVDIRSGKMLSVEALVRWIHPDRGMIPPAQFIPLAEQTGLIRPMTLAILQIAAQQQAIWIARGLQTSIAINLTARSLVDPHFLSRFSEILANAGVPPGLIDIEITESSLVDDPEGAQRMLTELRELGCQIYIDDFGTGYSSLSYLVKLPVHALKIDRSFIIEMDKNQGAYLVVASVISMAQSLGLRVVAEGVETNEDVERLRELGCDEGQGYLYCKPQPAAELEGLWQSGKLVRATAGTP
jgi:diguanylate cyclase (GGDEF)-like protein